MRAGMLRDRITVIRKTATNDGMGGQSIVWQAVATDLPATVVSTAGQRRFVGGGEQDLALMTHQIHVRGNADIQSADRIVWLGKLLDIVNASPTQDRPPRLRVQCRERVGETFVFPPADP